MYPAKTIKVELRLSGYSRAAVVRLLQEGAQAKLELAGEVRCCNLEACATYGELLACAAELRTAACVIQEAE